MSIYNSFEDLPVWQNARELGVLIGKIIIEPSLREYRFKEQMGRAVLSVSSNIAEGFERGSKTELIQFLYIAKGSCGELRSQMHLLKDIGCLEDKEFKMLYEKCEMVSKQIFGFIEYLKRTELRGHKFKQMKKI